MTPQEWARLAKASPWEKRLRGGGEAPLRPPALAPYLHHPELLMGNSSGLQASSSHRGRAGGPPASSPCAPSTAWVWGGGPWLTRSCRS